MFTFIKKIVIEIHTDKYQKTYFIMKTFMELLIGSAIQGKIL